MFRIFLLLSIVFIFSFSPCLFSQVSSEELPVCEWCGANEAPENINSETTITTDESGEPLIVSGTVLMPDKKTPAAGMILYVYHTNKNGIYPKRGDETGNGRRHGYLRAWMLTNENGEFQFITIRPGSYPNSRSPQHIHMTLKPPDEAELYLTTLYFADDPFLTEREYKDGYVVTPKRDNGHWVAEPEIIIQK